MDEQLEKEFEEARKRGEIVYQDEVTEDRWEWLVQMCHEDPEHYIEMESCIQIVPQVEDFTGVTNDDR